MSMRQKILENRFGLPSYELFLAKYGKKNTSIADRMMKALWSSYLHKGEKNQINLCWWADQFNNDAVLNKILITLAKAGWIETLAAGARNWAEATLPEKKLLNYVTVDELVQVRRHFKFRQYCLKEEEQATDCDIVRVNGRTTTTGLTAPGAMALANVKFSYDTQMMEEYSEIISLNLTKSMDKIAEITGITFSDSASYDSLSVEILDYYLNNPGNYTRGTSYMDSRGRAISNCLSKVGNPIGFKDFRSLIQLPTY